MPTLLAEHRVADWVAPTAFSNDFFSVAVLGSEVVLASLDFHFFPFADCSRVLVLSSCSSMA